MRKINHYVSKFKSRYCRFCALGYSSKSETVLNEDNNCFCKIVEYKCLPSLFLKVLVLII